MIQPEEIEARIDLLRAAIASVIEASRDVGLTVKQTKEVVTFLEASKIAIEQEQNR